MALVASAYYTRRSTRPSGTPNITRPETLPPEDPPEPKRRRELSMRDREGAPFLEVLSGRDWVRVEQMRAGYFGEGYAR